MKSSLVFLYVFVVGILIFSALFFGFSVVKDNGVSPAGDQTASVRNASPEIIPVPVLPAQENSRPTVDYSKILEKYTGLDVERVATNKKIIALTFDGGGNADGVEKILGVLSENSIQPTFFLTGEFIEKFPKAVEEIKKSGGEIANHTYSHKNFTSLNAGEATEEINKMKAATEKNDVSVAPFFRFPYGARKKDDIVLVNNLGYTAARWTVDSLGWQGKIENHDAKFVSDRVMGKVAPGAIVLMHLGSAPDKSALDADALIDIVKTLKEQGYQFVSLSELFEESL